MRGRRRRVFGLYAVAAGQVEQPVQMALRRLNQQRVAAALSLGESGTCAGDLVVHLPLEQRERLRLERRLHAAGLPEGLKRETAG